jgi:3-hydroxymyristoyl/3-hydroxydecanoyl-(acyl carrier protein) dehydratase
MCPDRDELLPGVELVRIAPAEEGALSAEVRVAAGSPLFDGHFPGQPVLPGVAVVGLVVALCRRAFGDVAVKGLERVKLLAPVSPGARLRVSVRRAGSLSRFEVVSGSDGARVASGAIAWE